MVESEAGAKEVPQDAGRVTTHDGGREEAVLLQTKLERCQTDNKKVSSEIYL